MLLKYLFKFVIFKFIHLDLYLIINCIWISRSMLNLIESGCPLSISILSVKSWINLVLLGIQMPIQNMILFLSHPFTCDWASLVCFRAQTTLLRLGFYFSISELLLLWNRIGLFQSFIIVFITLYFHDLPLIFLIFIFIFRIVWLVARFLRVN